MRSFCVIPHAAREHKFFDAVFEDGVRVQHDGRLLALPFTHVLSPAHDLARQVNGPLLQAVRDRRNAMLLIATPAFDEQGEGRESVRAGHSRKGGAGDGGAPGSSRSAASARNGLEDCNAVTMDLAGNLLPLLFHSAQTCEHASVSVVTVSAQERVVVDELANASAEVRGVGASSVDDSSEGSSRRVRSLQEVTWVRMARESSAAHWGTVFNVLTSRLAAQAQQPDSLAGQTACVVSVQLEDGYGRVALVLAGSDQVLLQSLTLILGVAGGSDSAAPRTFPPRTPLLTLLQENTRGLSSSPCVVHVVAVPEPSCEERNSLRVMRFASDAAFYGAPPTLAPSKEEAAVSRRRRSASRRASAAAALANVPPASSKWTPTATAGAAEDGADTSRRAPIRQPPSSPPPVSSASVPAATTASTTIAAAAAAAAAAADDLSTSSQQEAREQHLVTRVAHLERQLRELSNDYQAVQAARDAVSRQVGSLQRQLRERQDAWLELEEGNAQLQSAHAQSSAVIPKLLKKVSMLEKKRDELLAGEAASLKTQALLKESVEKKDETIATMQKRLRAMEQRETKRVREANLSRLSNDTDVAARDEAGRRSQKERLAAVAVEELRRRNRELERSLHQAENRAANARAGPGAHVGSTPTCRHCLQLQERLDYFTRELNATRQEKDLLTQALRTGTEASAQTRPPSTSGTPTSTSASFRGDEEPVRSGRHTRAAAEAGDVSTGAVACIAASLLSGCASLRMQLEAILGALDSPGTPRAGVHIDPVTGIDPRLIREHLETIRALEVSLHDTARRRWRRDSSTTFSDTAEAAVRSVHSSVSSARSRTTPRGEEAVDGSVPTTATAADVAALTSRLTFEAERVVHLRAFLPTFTQLAVATEHLRLRLRAAAARRPQASSD